MHGAIGVEHQCVILPAPGATSYVHPYCLQGAGKRRKQQAAVTAASAPGQIPPQELAALNTFLIKVYKWRAWQGGSYHITTAWNDVELAAATAAGGCWQTDFDGLQLSAENCNKLLGVIDQVFFSGKILKRLRTASSQQQQQVQPPESNCSLGTGASGRTSRVSSSTSACSSKLQCKIVQAYGPNATWLCYFDPNDNVIYINRWRWGKHINPKHPVNFEGVVCTCRLHMLMHTLAHELVHAIVFHLFPEIDKTSPAYLADDRHGPIFQLLNKQLFGHSSCALEEVQLVPCRHS